MTETTPEEAFKDEPMAVVRPRTPEMVMERRMGEAIQRQQREAQAPQMPILTRTLKRATVKIGRNEPCPCESGKKFKRCCAETYQNQYKHMEK
jgi:uncharacterized protein